MRRLARCQVHLCPVYSWSTDLCFQNLELPPAHQLSGDDSVYSCALGIYLMEIGQGERVHCSKSAEQKAVQRGAPNECGDILIEARSTYLRGPGRDYDVSFAICSQSVLDESGSVTPSHATAEIFRARRDQLNWHWIKFN